MKRKKFTKLLSMLLVLSTLLTFGTLAVSADTHASSDGNLFKLDNGDISTVDQENGYYTSDTIGYYATYLGSDSSFPNEANGYTTGVWTNLKTAGKFNATAKRYEMGCADQWIYASKFQVNYHYMIAVGFTAPAAGMYSFEYQYGMTALGNTSENYKILIGKEFSFDGNKWTTASSALHSDVIPRVNTTDRHTATYDIKLNEGETLYFALWNSNNGGYGTFWIKSIEQKTKVEANPTSWYFGDINSFSGFIDDEVIKYVYYQQGAYDNITTPQGVYDMEWVTGQTYTDRYIIGGQTTSSGTTTVSNSYVRSGNVVAPQYWYTPGLAFVAPYTGTVRFTVQTKMPNTDHNLVVGRSTVSMNVDNGHTEGVIDRQWATTVNKVEERIYTIDVTKGESIYFLIDNLDNGYETTLQLKSAEYVYGDLNENPVTFVAAQETDAYTNGSVQAFDVRLISAVSKNTDTTKNVGFKYSLTINGETAAENKSYTMSETFKKLTANTDKGIEEISAPQGTSFMAGVLTLPASGTVVITVTSWAETADGTYNDTACQITYTDGAFVKMENINA